MGHPVPLIFFQFKSLMCPTAISNKIFLNNKELLYYNPCNNCTNVAGSQDVTGAHRRGNPYTTTSLDCDRLLNKPYKYNTS